MKAVAEKPGRFSGLMRITRRLYHTSNVAGATVLSLGCQNAQIELLEEEIAKKSPKFDKPIYFLEQQKMGLETDC
jgi:altronate dehydratase